MSERIATFYHGTTALRAKAIVTDAGFGVQRTFLALGQNRDLAEIFAHRTVSKHPNEGGPALVIVTMGEEAFEALRKSNQIRLTGFDPEDRAELRGRNQWVLDGNGVEQFNRDADDWDWVAI